MIHRDPHGPVSQFTPVHVEVTGPDLFLVQTTEHAAMYNGIGLPTPRGSGTSGYIQRNLSFIKPRRSDFPVPGKRDLGEKPPKLRKVNPELVAHERKRQVEIQLLQLSDKLEAEGVDSEEIKTRVAEERKKLLKVAATATEETEEAKAPTTDQPPSPVKERKTRKKGDSVPW